MTHTIIALKNIGFFLPHKVCFEGLTTHIHYKKRIGIMGRNGSGKSTLLRIIQGHIEPSEGQVVVPHDVQFGYVPQIVEGYDSLSGAQKLNKALTEALIKQPNVLCLDEPTNHFDTYNKKSLIKMLDHYEETLIVVSHDIEILRHCVDEIWHIDAEKVCIFAGNYDAYIKNHNDVLNNRYHQLKLLEKDQKKACKSIQAEQKRAAQSKRANHHENDRALKGAMKEKGSKTSGRKQGHLNQIKENIDQTLQNFHIPEAIHPKFNLKAHDLTAPISVRDGSCGYGESQILENIQLSILPKERIAFLGKNGSGKSTLVKALINDPTVRRSGHWEIPSPIGYLDQHYHNLNPEKSVFDHIKDIKPAWTSLEIRKHLNDFLFRKNEEVEAKSCMLSGGEKARLSLAQIAAQNPKLLILDEITNNLDIETKEHVIQVLKAYPGTLIVISHDEDFLQKIHITTWYEVSCFR